MNETPMKTRPLSPETVFLREQYYAAKTGQSDLMDGWARDLLKLELAIPGLYATVLKLVEGSEARAPASPLLFGVFGCWGAALLITVVALVPRGWRVDESKVKAHPAGEQEPLSLEGFFSKTAEYKRRLLVIATFLFFAGLFLAALMSIGR